MKYCQLRQKYFELKIISSVIKVALLRCEWLTKAPVPAVSQSSMPMQGGTGSCHLHFHTIILLFLYLVLGLLSIVMEAQETDGDKQQMDLSVLDPTLDGWETEEKKFLSIKLVFTRASLLRLPL